MHVNFGGGGISGEEAFARCWTRWLSSLWRRPLKCRPNRPTVARRPPQTVLSCRSLRRTHPPLSFSVQEALARRELCSLMPPADVSALSLFSPLHSSSRPSRFAVGVVIAEREGRGRGRGGSRWWGCGAVAWRTKGKAEYERWCTSWASTSLSPPAASQLPPSV